MKLAIVAGGPEELLPDLDSQEYDEFKWIGADHGTLVILKSNRKPIRAFGDFDSLSDIEKEAVLRSSMKIETFPPEKDRTDLEIALEWALKQNPEKLLVFGATGGRVDHMLSAVQLLLSVTQAGVDGSIVDRKNCVTLLPPGTYHIKKNAGYPYLSFLSLTGSVRGLTLKGVKYPLTDTELPVGSSLCISNEPVGCQFTVSLSAGYLLMMRCRD
ncbi:thiamine diphosphokinase [Sporolactobacillus sp. Y61]|uniref:Thiamine diphosphokinase n=1 Tax=Sporolactobacillus sp. Y61 TaxID=3160863 RepID=A0AAU8ICT5_9BACL|nr:thiamine diphosphokinase [Sporolactobacillus sp. THM19-2]RYL92914.1 thiamine diphosphokinase [Sporolactobacillus sp. THM19-2]